MGGESFRRKKLKNVTEIKKVKILTFFLNIEYKMETKYFCEICGTRPDQFSHHAAHLLTQKHKKNCDNFVTEMKIFSLLFTQIIRFKWDESEYADYIINKYKTEKNVAVDVDVEHDDITEWYKKIRYSYGNGKYDWNNECFGGKTFPICYEEEVGVEWDYKNNEAKNWAINRILKYKETVQTKPKKKERSKTRFLYQRLLSKETNVNFNKIIDIRNGLIDLRYLIQPIQLLDLKVCDIEIYGDEALRYSCILFDNYGIQRLYMLYDGYAPADIEENPELKKRNTFYFYKSVNIEHTSTTSNVNNKKESIWLSCNMDDFIDYLDNEEKCYENNVMKCSYMPIEDFKYFIKETLIEVFSNYKKHLEHGIECEKNKTLICKWKKSDEKILRAREDTYYLINKHEAPFFKKDVHGIIAGVCNTITEEERDISLCQKLTEEQIKEYCDFQNKQTNRIEELKEELKFSESEILKIKEFSLSSNIIKSIVQICKYLFEYDTNLIQHYKSHMYIAYVNGEKETMERMNKQFMEEGIEF